MHQDRHKSDKIHSIAAHVVHEEMGGSLGDETNENAFELHHRVNYYRVIFGDIQFGNQFLNGTEIEDMLLNKELTN